MPHPKKSQRRGLTLIEIVVVVAIIGLLMAAVGVSVVEVYRAARIDTAKTDIVAVHNALKTHFVKVGRYPTNQEGLAALVVSRVFDKLPKDPWGHDYVYELAGERPEVRSWGPDGAAGTNDDLTAGP